MSLTFQQLEDFCSRLPVTSENRGVFEALLALPYDIFRPVMDMLFEGVIVIEDLYAPSQQMAAAAAIAATDSANAHRILAQSSNDVSSRALRARCIALASGTAPSGVVLSRDGSSLLVDSNGAPSGAFASAGNTLLGADASTYVPNPIELARAGNLAAAQKAAQERLAAAIHSEVK